MQILIKKFKETLFSVLPIVAIVLLLHITIVPLETDVFARFIIGSLILVLGLTLFLMGVDIGITPIGNLLGKIVTRSNKLWLVLLSGLVLGIITTVAEPSLIILAKQIDIVTSGGISSSAIITFVSLGTGILLSVGLIRIVFKIKLKILLFVSYSIVFVFSLLSNSNFLGLAFDASGATTGALAVPFILAIASGTANINKDTRSSEDDSFGLVGVASIGAIIAVLLMGITNKMEELSSGIAIEKTVYKGILSPFIKNFIPQFIEVLIALLPILIIFIFANFISFKLKKHKFHRILVGLILSTIGLVFFLLGVNQGFMEVGTIVGAQLASANQLIILNIIAFVLGLVTILAEPAVHILTKQIEKVTSGYVKKKLVMITLAVGVGFAVMLSSLRVIIPGLQFWHIILPGYIIAIVLLIFTPNLFVGIAFDSGGVASGPMTATFVLVFIQGISSRTANSNVLLDGFGVIALVAMIPLIALQVLGIVYKVNTQKLEVQSKKYIIINKNNINEDATINDDVALNSVLEIKLLDANIINETIKTNDCNSISTSKESKNV